MAGSDESMQSKPKRGEYRRRAPRQEIPFAQWRDRNFVPPQSRLSRLERIFGKGFIAGLIARD